MITFATDVDKVLKLGHPCRCPKCENSCNYGSGVLGDGDLQRLAEFLEMSEEKVREECLEEIEKFNTKRLRPKIMRKDGKPYGKCIFYDNVNGCKVHPAKPLECKVAMGCKPYGEELIAWFDLKHFFNPNDPESLRQLKVYIEAGGKLIPGAELENFADADTLKKIQEYDDLKDDTDWPEVLGIKDILEKEGKNDERE
ncbi:YkgJ family cysteine cluster protein [Candidatus Woesearchaeota archaeon]|nr:YkgJ family cysteine cluster protein [Candidatus Woesearchaeota archaeon]